MPSGSRYTPRQRHTPSRGQNTQTAKGKSHPILVKTKKAIDAVATYIHKNQEAHRKHGVTPLNEDIERYVGNFVNKTGDFGEETRMGIRRSCRRDSDERIFEDLQGRRYAPRHTERYTSRGEPVFEAARPSRVSSTSRHHRTVRRPRERIIEIYEEDW